MPVVALYPCSLPLKELQCDNPIVCAPARTYIQKIETPKCFLMWVGLWVHKRAVGFCVGEVVVPESVTMSSWESPFLAKASVSWAAFAVKGGRFACASDAAETLPSLRPAGTA
jgi:hypothetical protein